MAYDEGLAERIRGVLEDREDVSEKRMFGGLAFLVKGRMSVGIVKDELMVRVGPVEYDRLLQEPHVRRMDFTGRPMKGFLFIASSGLESDADLAKWIDRGVVFASALPAQGAHARPRSRRQVPNAAPMKAQRRKAAGRARGRESP